MPLPHYLPTLSGSRALTTLATPALLAAAFALGSVRGAAFQESAVQASEQSSGRASDQASDQGSRGGAPVPLEVSGFAFELAVRVDAPPAEAFDAFTGDVSGWWDHHFSKSPHALRIEPRPGGAFIELFDDEGNGALHATVTRAQRGSMLQFRGPLGFAAAGVHFDMAHTVRFEAEEEGTRLTLRVRGVGEVEEGWPESAQRAWRHFLEERFVPYVAGEL